MMYFEFQNRVIEKLKLSAESDLHSILVSGSSGSGKTYICKQYADMCNIGNVLHVLPTVDSIRSAIESCYTTDQKILLLVENIDTGVPSSSNTLLKFLEEPLPHVYIIVTCRNIQRVLPTIISRCVSINLQSPQYSDLCVYAESLNREKCEHLKSFKLFKTLRSFSDIDAVMKMSDEQISYIMNFDKEIKKTASVSSLSWKICHFKDNTDIPISMIVYYLYFFAKNTDYRLSCLDCLRSLESSSISKNAILSKLLFELKYAC